MARPTFPAAVETRCSVAVFRGQSVLLVRGSEQGSTVWKLPGGHVRDDEDLAACAWRELREETGLEPNALHHGFLVDLHETATDRFLTEIVMYAVGPVHGRPQALERGHEPQFVPLSALPALSLVPPIAGHLRDLHRLHEQAFTGDRP
ncbi:NUDIX domain-containing protein [Streptomyces sp. HNM0575]|uniref:NUDIX hydrolase n=1 Tax=Streptomyces sp. HNM0575 TaxID=2716338 RepID=UPI0019D2B838|nr:NUDIX domain-containing protein [Streptomyces sp. HNM0575]